MRRIEGKGKQALPPLPPGVLPHQAASFHAWLWVMGAASHRNSLTRKAHRKTRIILGTLVGRWSAIRAPYRQGHHPGYRELLHALLGISPDYARRLMRGSAKLPAMHADRLARDLEVFYEGVPELIGELRRYAEFERRRAAGELTPRIQATVAAKRRKAETRDDLLPPGGML